MSDDWHNEFSELIDGTIDSILSRNDKVTSCDVGLLLTLLQDYIEEEGHIDKYVHTIRVAQEILEVKEDVDDISWFDIYDIFVSVQFRIDSPATSSEVDYDESDLYTPDDTKTAHSRQFREATISLFEATITHYF